MARFFCSAIVCLLGIQIPTLGLVFWRPAAHEKASGRTLTFAERVTYQWRIEEVYWRHRIWPKDNPQPKPRLDAIISQAQLKKKVEEYLSKSQALEDYWQRPITAEELQTEIDRMARDTKQPDVLHELLETLGNSPVVIAECLARPALAERLRATLTMMAAGPPAARNFFAAGTAASTQNRIRVTANLHNAQYKLPEVSVPDRCSDDTWTATSTVNVPDARFAHTAVWTGSEMIIWGGFNSSPPYLLNTGGRYDPATDIWTATSTTNAPTGRGNHTAVWTGTEMIVWGGQDSGGASGTGGKYDPSTDSWSSTNITNSPHRRFNHTAVWTGSEMII